MGDLTYKGEPSQFTLMDFRKQAVEDGYFSTIGTLTRDRDGFQVLKAEGETWEFYTEGENVMVFKIVGAMQSFKVRVDETR